MLKHACICTLKNVSDDCIVDYLQRADWWNFGTMGKPSEADRL